MKTRLARWPLVFLVLFGAGAAASTFLLPRLDPALAVAGIAVAPNADLIVLALSGLALIFGSLSWLLRKQVPITSSPAAPAASASAAPARPASRSEARAARKGAPTTKLSKEEKARLAADEKFRKQAEKEAAAASKKAARAQKRGKVLVTETAVNTSVDEPGRESLANSILAAGGDPQAVQYSEDDSDRSTGVVYDLDASLPPVAVAAVAHAVAAQTEPTVQTEPTAQTEPTLTFEQALYGAPSNESGIEPAGDSLPVWATAAYSDPAFQVPFAQARTEANQPELAPASVPEAAPAHVEAEHFSTAVADPNLVATANHTPEHPAARPAADDPATKIAAALLEMQGAAAAELEGRLRAELAAQNADITKRFEDLTELVRSLAAGRDSNTTS
jgi:hypothetical protein